MGTSFLLQFIKKILQGWQNVTTREEIAERITKIIQNDHKFTVASVLNISNGSVVTIA